MPSDSDRTSPVARRPAPAGLFWKNPVELDLRGNPIDENRTKFLLERRPPPELERLTLDRNFPEAMCERLQDHFAGKVVFAEK